MASKGSIDEICKGGVFYKSPGHCSEEVTKALGNFPKDYYLGQKTYQQLQDVVVKPFVKVARLANKWNARKPLPFSSDEEKNSFQFLGLMLKDWYSAWHAAMSKLAVWWFSAEANRIPPAVLAEKHAAISEGIFKAGVPEVRQVFIAPPSRCELSIAYFLQS